MLNPAIISLIITNSIPIIGVIFYAWNTSTLLWVYFFELVIIGFFNIFKILKSNKKIDDNLWNPKTQQNQKTVYQLKISLIFWFILFYGFFLLFIPGLLIISTSNQVIHTSQIPIAIVVSIVSHWISYIVVYIGRGEYKQINPVQQMMQPLKRLEIMIIAIMLTLIVAFLSSSSLLTLIILIVVKTLTDLAGHLKEHKQVYEHKFHPNVFEFLNKWSLDHYEVMINNYKKI